MNTACSSEMLARVRPGEGAEHTARAVQTHARTGATIVRMNEIDLTLFGERMKQVLADTRAIKYDMSGLRAQFSALEARFSGLEARLNAVEVRLEHLDTLVDRMTDRMAAVQRGQATLEGRFDALEGLLREALGR